MSAVPGVEGRLIAAQESQLHIHAMRRAAGLILFLTVAACNAEFGPSGRYEKWLEDGPKSYVMTVRRTCGDCSEDMTGPVRVSVRGGVAVSRIYVSSGEAVPKGLDLFFPTVTDLFFMIDALKVDKRYKLDVEYDPELEIPVAIKIETFQNGADVEIGIYVTEFQTQ